MGDTDKRLSGLLQRLDLHIQQKIPYQEPQIPSTTTNESKNERKGKKKRKEFWHDLKIYVISKYT